MAYDLRAMLGGLDDHTRKQVAWWLEGKKWFRVQHGGRGSGKTAGAALAILLLMLAYPELRIACLRREKVAVRESVYEELRRWIVAYPRVRPDFDVQRDRIVCLPTGSEIVFPGVSPTTAESVRGTLSGKAIVFLDEAHQVEQAAWDIFTPSIRPAPGTPHVELWCCLNPKFSTDPAYKQFVVERRGGRKLKLKQVNYYDNPFFPDWLETLRRDSEEFDPPAVYRWRWLGELMPSELEEGVWPVLTREALDACMALWDQRPTAIPGRYPVLGWDVAGLDAPRHGLVVRHGPTVLHIEKFGRSTWPEIGRHVRDVFEAHGCRAVYYDATGVGAAAGAQLDACRVGQPTRRFPVAFGGKPWADHAHWLPGVTNAQQWRDKAAQMAWVLKLRADNSRRRLAGEDIPIGLCLLIDPRTPKHADVIAELAQPVWHRRDLQERTKIEKDGLADLPSPDYYDAMALAFATDAAGGLRASDWHWIDQEEAA